MLCSKEMFAYPFLSYFHLPEEEKKKSKQKPCHAETAFPQKGRAMGVSQISSEDLVVVVDFAQKTFKNHSNEAV